MPALQMVASRPGSGKTTLAVALAQGLARAGQRVRLARTGTGAAADEDAETFASFLFAASTGQATPLPPPSSPDDILILELDAGAVADDVPAIIAVRGAPNDEDTALASSLGERLLGTIAVAIAPEAVENVGRDLTNGGLRPLAVLAEDRTLTAPSVAEIGEILNARVLFQAENEREVVDDVIIAPVYADPARPHFRRFASKAILAPFNKTDLHLVAIETNAACLVITGGKDPSPYVVDRAQHGSTTVLLSRWDTPATVVSLSDVWSRSRFRGEAKAASAYAHLEGRIDFANFVKKLQR
jgi:BioD-like phosphotransacetylase family protein